MADTAADTTTPWVQVVVLGGDVHRLDYEPGMTVQQVLEAANLNPQEGQVVTINGAPAGLDQTIEPNSVVQLTSKVNNG